MSKPTCGPLYFEGLRTYAGSDPAAVRLFAAGFISGEAEKVYLGACHAAMFRPSPEHHGMVSEIVADVVQRYDLYPIELNDEIWICRDAGAFRQVQLLAEIPVNSPEWHGIRGWLCGVPASETDYEFHERKGYGEPCDLVTANE